MSKQPEAIRLAANLSMWPSREDLDESSRELLRLHALNGELLEALKKRSNSDNAYLKLALMDCDSDRHELLLQCIEEAEEAAKASARAAIAKAEASQ